ncbi:MAG: hypothetical protein ACLQAT_09360 [Candidatus Binataceae bacterium]
MVFSIAAAVPAADQGATQGPFASAQQVELFRGQSFLLGDDTSVAIVRGLDWSKDRSIKIPFWLGTGNAVPPTARAKEGGYYVISEAYIVRSLGGKEWLIRAGSSLQKPDAVLITNRTHYKTTGVILPTIIQYTGTRNFTRSDGSKIDIPVLQEVSLPMTWTAQGKVPTLYAKFMIHR